MTKVKMVIFGCLLLLAIGLIAGSFYLNSDGFRQILLKHANAAIDGRLAIKHHRVGILSGKLSLSNVELIDHRGLPLASVQQIDINLSWPALLWRRVQISSLSIEKAIVHLRYDHQDKLQLITVKSAKPSDPLNNEKGDNNKWSLRIDDGRLIQGALYLERQSKGLSARVEGIEIAAGIDLQQPGGQVQITTGPLHWQHGASVRNMAALKLTASLDADQDITFNIQVPDAKLAVAGRPPWSLTDPDMDLIVNLDADVEAIQTWLPEAAHLKGMISTQLTAKGPLEDPTMSVSGQWTNGQIMAVPFDMLTADLRLHEHRVTIKGLHSKSIWGALQIDGTIDLPPRAIAGINAASTLWDALEYDFKLKGSDLHPDRLVLLEHIPKGTYHITSQVTGGGLTGPRAHGKANIDMTAAALLLKPGAKTGNGHLGAKLHWQGQEVELQVLEASVAGNRIQANAQLNPFDGSVKQATAHFKTESIEELGALLGVPLPSGEGEVKLRCHGPLHSPNAHIELLARQLVLDKRPFGRLLAEANLGENGVLQFSRITLENQGSLVQANGQITLRQADGRWASDPGITADLTFQQLAPADFGWLPSLSGHLNGHAHLHGSLGHLYSDTVLTDSPVAWGGFAGHVKGKGYWKDGRLVIPELNLFNKASAIRLKGSANWRWPGSNNWSATPDVRAEIDGRNILLQDFSQDHKGVLSLKGNVAGAGDQMTGSFQASGNTLTIGNQPIQRFALKGNLADSKIVCEGLHIDVLDNQTIKADGWYSWDRQFQLHLAAVDVGLEHITSLQEAYPISGRMALDMEASGAIDNPQMSADMKVRLPLLKEQYFDDFNLKANLSNHQLNLTAGLNFDLTAQYHMTHGDFDVQAHFDQTEIDPYLALWVGKGWGGMLTGRLQARGNRRQPDQIHGELAINDSELRYGQQPVILAPQLRASLENRLLEVPATRLALLGNGFINLEAQGRLPNQLNIVSDGQLPIAALAPFFRSIEGPQGELLFQASAQGALADMQWHADLDLKEIGFDLPGLGHPLAGLNGHLAITPDKLAVQDLTGRMDEGYFTLAGKMGLKDWHPYNGALTLSAHALPLQWPGYMDLIMSGDINLHGDVTTPRLTGGLELLEGLYYKDVRLNLLSAVTQKRRKLSAPSTVSMPPQFGKILLDIDVTHRSPLLVDNNLANLQIAPDLKISGTLARPIVSGRAEVTEGEVVFRGRTFAIQRGVVDFINPYKIEPNLDIYALADIREWWVSLALSGTPDQLLVDLQSNHPEASESDILSLILLGRTSSELSKGEGGQTTQQMLATLIGMAWGEEVRKQSGLDILEVETGSEDASQSADRTQLTVGKRLSRRLTVKYEVESGSEEVVQRAVSEYRFLEHLLASGFQNSKGEYGTELLFRMEF